MPMVALFLAIEAAPVSEFANLGGLTEAYEEPVIIPCLKGIQCVIQRCEVDLGRCLS